MKKYIVLISLLTNLLYSMNNESEIIDFDTVSLNENSRLIIDRNKGILCSHDKQESTPDYTYATTIKHASGDIEDIIWHPTEKNKLFTITSEKIHLWNTQKNEDPMLTVTSDENTYGFKSISTTDDGKGILCASSNVLFVSKDFPNQPLKKYLLGEYYTFLASHAIYKSLFIPKRKDITVSIFGGNRALGLSNKNVITFKNIENNESEVIYNQSGYCKDMAIHPLNENILMTAQKENVYLETTFNIFDIQKKQLIHDISCDITKIACHPTNAFTVATCAWQNKDVNFWDLRKKNLKAGYLKTGGYSCFENTGVDIKWLSDGHNIVVTSANRTQIYDIRTGNCSQALDNKYSFFHAIDCCGKDTGQHRKRMYGTCVHPEDQQLVTYSCDEIKVWKHKNN